MADRVRASPPHTHPNERERNRELYHRVDPSTDRICIIYMDMFDERRVEGEDEEGPAGTVADGAEGGRGAMTSRSAKRSWIWPSSPTSGSASSSWADERVEHIPYKKKKKGDNDRWFIPSLILCDYFGCCVWMGKQSRAY
jgi:hypothetical protein